MNSYQLPGARGPVPQMPTGLIVIAVLFVASLLAYGGWKVISIREAGAAPKPQATAHPEQGLSEERVEDVESHFRHMEALAIAIQEKERSIHKHISQVSPTLQQNYLNLEYRRLDGADQLTQSVLRDAGELLDEIQLAKQNLATGDKQWLLK